MKKDLKTIVITLVILVVFGFSAFFIGKYLGKKDEEQGNKGEVPDETNWSSGLTTSEKALVKENADALYKDMNGWNVKRRDTSIYTKYLATSDKVFVETAKYFEEKYGNGENLAQWIDGENFFLTNYLELSKTIDKIIERLEKFGIKA